MTKAKKQKSSTEEALQYRLRFEKVIMTISSRFINLEPGEVDHGIEDALGSIGMFAGVDRAYLFQFTPDAQRFSNSHEWCGEGIDSHKTRLQKVSVNDFPWVSEKINRGEIIHVPTVEDLPVEATAEKVEFTREGILSLLNVPIILSGTVVGFVGFDSVRQEKSWNEDTISLLKIVGEIFGNALQRKRTEQALREANEQLERRVAQRTAELEEANRSLQNEIGIRNREIMERIRAEDAMRRSEERYRDLFENASDFIQMVSPDHRFLYVNRAWKSALGYTTQDLAALRMFDILPKDQAARYRELVHRATNGEDVGKFETEFVKKNGSHIAVEGSFSYKQENDKLAWIRGIFRDVSQRKEIDRIKNEFVTTVSHELRTPLTAIHGSLGALTSGVGGDLSTKAKAFIEIAYKNSARLVRLTSDFLDLQKMEAGRVDFSMRPVELMPIVEQTLEANRGFADKYGVQFVLVRGVSDVRVNADIDRLMQVMTNLLSNAAKFSPADGTVEISVSNQSPFVRVSVTDHGPGVPVEFHKQLFQKFAQAPQQGEKKGTGLGLSISKSIIERMGGTVGFHSEPGKGATFFFDLPILS